MWTSLVASALAATFPSTADLPGLDRIDARPMIQRLRAEAPLLLRLALYGAVLVFHLSPLFTLGVPLPAWWLSSARRDQHANALSVSRIFLFRQVMLMVKTVGGLCWGGDPTVRAALTLPAYRADPGTWRTS